MAHLRQPAPLPESQQSAGALIRLCPACGDPLVNGRCPECAPAAPARAYGESSGRKTAIFASSLKSTNASPAASAVDSRRASAEWVTPADDADPQTRKAHPTQVRTALNEAGELARARLKRETMAYPRRGENGARNQTDPRVKKVPDFRDALSAPGAHDADDAPTALGASDDGRSDLRSRATTPVSVASALAQASARLGGSVSSKQHQAHPSTSKRVRPTDKPGARTSQPLEPTAIPAVAVEPTPAPIRTISATALAATDGPNDHSTLVDLDLPTLAFPGKTLAIVLGVGALLGCLFAALI